jgi:hypothetical protein
MPNLTPWPAVYKQIGIPPLALLEPFLEAPANFTGHVGWNGIDPAHPEADFNEKTREAIFIWPFDGRLERNGKVDFVARGRFPVVRVLYHHLRHTKLERTIIMNTCDNMACCNLDHWRVVTREEVSARRRIVVYTAFDSPHFKRHA